MIVKITQKSKKCSICYKEQYDCYPWENILQSFNAFFNNNLKKYYIDKYTELNNSPHESMTVNNNLIRPCRCLKVIHYQCLLNQCLFLLSFKCSECNWVYSFDFISKQPNITTNKIVSLLFIIVLLALALIFIFVSIIPIKYFFWNYIIGFIMLIFSIVTCFILLNSRKKNKVFNDTIILPYEDNKEQNEKDLQLLYHKIREYSLSKYDMCDIELIERQNDMQCLMKLDKEYDINHSIKIINSNFNKPDKEEEEIEEVEERFGNYQIIKSTLMMKPEHAMHNINQNVANDKEKEKNLIYKCKTKTNQSNPNKSPMNRIPLKRLSRTPLLMIKEAKEILEDFSPVNMESKKKKTMNFLLSFGNKKHTSQMPLFSKEKPQDNLLLTLKNNQ